ncbi:MAG: hypothetical protein ACT6R6_18595, partial [Flavobacterium sp.]|uniref:hypothetical protein n=1 Tax=Flavobacterium sp. TaxID=239 RepID=UPI00403395F1
MTAQWGVASPCHRLLLLLLLGLGWAVSQALIAQARVLLALGWQLRQPRPPTQLQQAPPALP